MGRPKAVFTTTQKTYMLYEDDIQILLDSGKAPKDVFRLGIQALVSGWTPHKESVKIEEFQKRLSHLAFTLETYVQKFNILAQAVEKGLKIDLDPELVSVAELEERLKQIELQEKELDKLKSGTRRVNNNKKLQNGGN